MGKVVVHTAAPIPQPYTQGAVLVVGGMGTLGTVMVGWLAAQGVRCIPVLSRTGKLSSSIEVLLAQSSACHQAQVVAVQCDSGFAADVAALPAAWGGAPLAAVLHAGGVLADSTFANQDAASVRKASKRGDGMTSVGEGAWHRCGREGGSCA